MEPIELNFVKTPGFLTTFPKALLKGSRVSSELTGPALCCRWSTGKLNQDKLKQYRHVTGFLDSDLLPPTYPHILAGPMHVGLLTHSAFPLPPMGLIHTENTISQLRPLRPDEVFDITVTNSEVIESRRGLETQLLTTVKSQGERVWESTTTLLCRNKKRTRSKKKEATLEALPQSLLRSCIWRLNANHGRRYASVSGDYNPIHLTPLTARPFGFKQPIIHGMWSLARAVAECADDLDEACRIQVAFKRPISLPNRVGFFVHTGQTGQNFSVIDLKTSKVHLNGSFSPQ